MLPRDQHSSFGHGIDGEMHIRELLERIRWNQMGCMEMTHKVLELFDHPCKALCAYAHIILIKTRPLVNNVWPAVPYLDNIDVRKTSSLESSINKHSTRGGGGVTSIHVRRPREHEIPPPTYPRREQDPQQSSTIFTLCFRVKSHH